MIVRPENMDFTKQTFSAIIYGQPGIGKTTLALSAPKPVLIDFDRGISRVRAEHRTPTIVCDTYEEVLQDIRSADMKEFETIVIDTGGSFITFLKDWAMRTKKDAKTSSNQFNSLKGFGYVKAEFESFTEEITKKLNKNVIYVFHSVEQTDRDGNTEVRLMCEGSSKNLVWNKIDFGGCMQVIGDKRFIGFSQEEGRFAKGTHGIEGRWQIPTLAEGAPNTFMTDLFERARASIVAEKEVNEETRRKYAEIMPLIRDLIDNIVDAETATAAAQSIPEMEHVSTSKKEASALLRDKVDSIGLKWDKESKTYIPKE